MKNKTNIIKSIFIAIISISIFISLYIGLTKVFTPKFYDDTWAITSTYEGFYNMPPESVDVIFLGGSMGASAFDPDVLSKDYGISAYNLCSEQQSTLVSYYWLREALKTQHPKVVVLDTNMLFPNVESSRLNSEEPFVRAAMDPMKWSRNKLDAVQEICGNDPSHKILGYFIPLYRYHDRWGEMIRKYHGEGQLHSKPVYGKGYVKLDANDAGKDYEPLYPEGVDHHTDMHPQMLKFLDRIDYFCKQNGIHLLLVSTPSKAASYAIYNSVNDYAADHGINYIDFNEYRFYKACDYDFSKDNAEDSHANYKGAKKLTGFVGQLLKEVYFL